MPATTGDYVVIRYTIYEVTDEGEKLVDTTEEELARKYGVYDERKTYGEKLVILGKSQLIEAVEEALKEMNEGEEKIIIAPPEKAYGPHRRDLIIRIPLRQLRRYNITPTIGREVEIGGRVGRIIHVTERFAFIDFNHPLAGKKLKIHLKIEKILKEPLEKLRYLVKRWLNLDPIGVKLSNGGVAEITLSSSIVNINDLESRLQLLIRDIKETISEVNEVQFSFKIKLREEKAEESKKESTKQD